MQKIHYYLIIFTLLSVLFVIISNLKRENYCLQHHENCMNYYNYNYTTYNCKLCDSLIKTQYYAEN